MLSYGLRKILFISLKKLFCSWDIQIFVILISFPFQKGQIQKDKWKWTMMSWIDLYKFADGNNSKTALFYIIRLGQIKYTLLIKEYFWNYFVTWRVTGTNSRPYFLIILQLKGARFKRKSKVNFLKAYW